jgi:TolB-like protein
MSFDAPSRAVSFALRLQQVHRAERALPAVRIGIHMGEVTERPAPPGASKPTLVEGLAVDLASRISSLAVAGQVLMSSPVFAAARQRLPAEGLNEEVSWCLHGPYQFKGIDEPIEIHEAGFAKPSPLSAPPDSEKAQRGVTAATPHKASIAVLPFANMSADAENEYFSDGLAEEIINELTHISGLKVIARTSAFAFKGKHEDIRQIAEKLDVSNILEGSVRKAGNRIRVTAQLVSAADGSHLWSERYDREMADVFALQDEIAQAIAKALRLTLADKPVARQRYIPSVPAYEAYLKGRYHAAQMTPDGVARSKKYLEQAVALDPSFAAARSYLGNTYLAA